MNERDDENFRELLRRAVAPVADTELKQDLWPRMLRKLDEQTTRTSWIDWALITLLLVWCLIFPEVIPAMLYYL